MQAEVYIKARKVFVSDKVENTEKCPHCEEQGRAYFLRYFYLSLEEAIYKCGNSKCLYPFHHFVFKNLTDKTVYYYEEVEDGTNDIMLKVSMGVTNKYKSANPMRTELFSESQHNPDIESYDFDIFDFMNESSPVPSSSKTTTTQPNDDFLDFLDEIPTTSTNDNENNLGVDSFIDNLLNSTPSTSTIIWPSQQNSPPKTEELKLSKAVKYIEKVKGRKKVREEKPQETFLQRVRKTKAAQSTNKRKQTVAEKISTLISTAQNLRPSQFVNQLKSLDLKNSNSSFLRTLAKVKQDSKSEAPSSNVEVKNEPINASNVAEPAKPNQAKKRRPTQKKKNELMVEKKVPKPRKKPLKRPAATANMVPEENEIIDNSLGSIPVTIDLSRVSIPKIDKQEIDTIIQMKETAKKSVKRTRKKKTKVELRELKRVKMEQLDGGLTDFLTTMNTQNCAPNQMIAAPAETTLTVSKIETESPTDTVIPKTEMTCEKAEVELPSNPNDSKSDEEDSFTAFSPLTKSDLSKNRLMDLKSLKFIPNATNVEKTPAKRTYKRRSTISAKTKKINDGSDTQSENAPSQVSETNAKQRAKRKRAPQIQNNNNTDIDTIKPKEVEIGSSPVVIELSDHSNEANSSQHELTIDVEVNTSRNSIETHISESITILDNPVKAFKPKMNVNNRYHCKKFGKMAEISVSVNELTAEWDSASEGGTSTRSRRNRLSAESDVTIIYPNDPLDDSESASIISLDSRTETTEIEE